MKHVWHQQERC